MRKGYGIFLLFAGIVVVCLAAGPVSALGAENSNKVNELEQRIKALEDKSDGTDTSKERSHRLHPVHSEFGLEITGGLTFIVHGVANLPGQKRSEASISGDLAVEGPIGKDGMAVIVLDVQRGVGVEGLNLLAAPNGNPTGINADVESFNDIGVKVTQLYYEHHLFDGLIDIALGQLDITGYFDANNFANDETAQFMANVFVNNSSIEFGGSDNFYSPGLTLTFSPAEILGITVGVFDGDGDYARPFDDPFVMAEADIHLAFSGREGTYRLYYWKRPSRPAGNLEFLADPTDTDLLKTANQGLGISLDQYLTEHIGVWLRAGTQRERVSEMKAFLGGGISSSSWFLGRLHDTMGLGYGVNFIGRDYKDFKRNSAGGFSAGNEHYLEAYYNVFLGGSRGMGFHIAPDFQYIINRGGDRSTKNAFIYGLRLQADF
ncbi:MAG: carbohydrate porin [Thermodesulfobacteriota bacterium]